MKGFDEYVSLGCNCAADWHEHVASGGVLADAISTSDRLFDRPGEDGWFDDGWCSHCQSSSKFWTDRQFTSRRHPNWRERQVCEGCGFNSRMRFTLEHIKREVALDARAYATEFVTPLFAALASERNIVGSEFQQGTPSGAVIDGVPIQDVTNLSFADGSFDAVLSFDVIEHVPDYQSALAEFHRVLDAGGKLLLSAPFRMDMPENLLRAAVVDGTIVFHQPIEMHGDPMNPAGGILSFHTFGWQLLNDLRALGFEPLLRNAWSAKLGYLGQPGPLIVATKKA